MKTKYKKMKSSEKILANQLIEKFAIDYPRLNYFHYEITVLEKTDDKWIGDTWTERTRTRSIAHITLERPIIEKVFHHELMHVHLDTIFRPSFFLIQPSFNFDDCKINKRTMWEIGHFASFFEEWFVELYTFEHLYLNRDDKAYIELFLGNSYENYFRQMDYKIDKMYDQDYNDLSTLLLDVIEDERRNIIGLFKHAVINDHNKTPDQFIPKKVSGIKNELIEILQKYRDLTKFELADSPSFSTDFEPTNYVISLFSEFINLIGSHQSGQTEPLTIVKARKMGNNQIIFTKHFGSAISDFDDGMAAVDAQFESIISKIETHKMKGITDQTQMMNLIVDEFIPLVGNNAFKQLKYITNNLNNELIPKA